MPTLTIPDDFETLRFDRQFSLERLAEHYHTTIKLVSKWAAITLERIMARKIAHQVFDPRLYRLYRQLAKLTHKNHKPRPLKRSEAYAILGLNIEEQEELIQYMRLLKQHQNNAELKTLKCQYVPHYQYA
jgi:sensor histidine kinase YesM